MREGRFAGGGYIGTDRACLGRDIVLTTFPNLLQQLQSMLTVPKAWKTTNLVLLSKKCIVKELKNYSPIRLRGVTYTVFAKLIVNHISEILAFQQLRDPAGFTKGYQL